MQPNLETMVPVIWLILAVSASLCICGLNTFALLALWSAKRRQNEIFAERNKHLSVNSRLTERQNMQLEAQKKLLDKIGDILATPNAVAECEPSETKVSARVVSISDLAGWKRTQQEANRMYAEFDQ